MFETIILKNFSAVIHHKGAELTSLKSNNQEYIWEGNPEFWGKHSPVLFPIVGTLKNNCYINEGKQYHLPRHGFARDMTFKLIEKSENKVTFSLASSVETMKVYPFDFELQISYTLLNNKLEIGYQISNKNDFEMPFSIGAHPAFALPNDFENYSLTFDINETLTSFELENDLLSNKKNTITLKENKLPLTYSLFEKDALIFKKLQSKKITVLENNKPLLKIEFSDFKNLGIWTKHNAPFICIEPWLGYSDTLETTGNIVEKEGIQFIDSEKTFNCHFSVEIL
jgi:galactose mutarotase-like enzyme